MVRTSDRFDLMGEMEQGPINLEKIQPDVGERGEGIDQPICRCHKNSGNINITGSGERTGRIDLMAKQKQGKG